MARFSVILDACVLYPAPLRDLLMRLALTDLFHARWTDDIHREWIGALTRTGKYEQAQLERVRDLMDENVRDAKVYGYEPLIETIELPDPKDRHVVAAAIRSNSDAIVTFNVKDFPERSVSPFDIEIIHPDDFVCYQIEFSPGRVCQAIRNQRKALKKPPKTKTDFLAILQKQQLPQTAFALREFIELI